MRRKGEKPVIRSWQPWGPSHPVARMISTGDHWLQAWISQACTPWAVLGRRSGVEINRIREINAGGAIARAELDAFASVWGVDPNQVIASLPSSSLLID